MQSKPVVAEVAVVAVVAGLVLPVVILGVALHDYVTVAQSAACLEHKQPDADGWIADADLDDCGVVRVKKLGFRSTRTVVLDRTLGPFAFTLLDDRELAGVNPGRRWLVQQAAAATLPAALGLAAFVWLRRRQRRLTVP